MKRYVLLLALLLSGVAWGQVPISLLPAASTSTNGVEVFPVVQTATTKRMSLAQVVAYLTTVNNSWTGTNDFTTLTTFNSGINVTAGTVVFPGGMLNPSVGQGANFGPGTTGAAGTECVFLFNNVPEYSNWCITDPANTTFFTNKPSGAIIAFNGLVPICFGNVNADLCISDSGITVPTPTTPVPWPKVAYGSYNGIGSCVLDTQVENSGLASCTYSGTGQYIVFFTSGTFASPPACTVSAGSGSSGGSNANSVQSVTTAVSGPNIVATIIMFNVSIALQDNHFMLTCMGR